MPAKGKKSLPIDEDVHRLIDIESATTGKTMSALIREAWRVYKEALTTKDNAGSSTMVGSSKQPVPTVPIPVSQPKQKPEDMVNVTCSPGERKWILRFLNILRSGTIGARGIKWNIVMIMKGMGLPFDSEAHPLPQSDEQDREARAEIAIVERLVAEQADVRPAQKEAGSAHPPHRKRSGGT